jgi:hypothetical protein
MIVFSGAQVNRSSTGVWLDLQPAHLQPLTEFSEEIARALEFD